MKKFSILILILFSILIILSIFSLIFGSVHISISELFNCFSDEESAAYRIVKFVRLPRILGAILCGAALSVSGALIQNTLQNPLGSPNVLGMNSGAGLAVILVAAFFAESTITLPIAAFFGAFAALLLVTLLGKKAGGSQGLSKNALLLSGVALNAFIAAISDGLNVLIPDSIYSRTAFRIGSLSGVQADVLIPAGAIIALSIFVTFIMRHQLDILSLGDETARSLGLKTGRCRLIALVLASLLCGAGISFAGLIGFVGLIVPHCSRIICRKFEPRHTSKTGVLIIISALSGACLVLLCDLISRLIFAPYELPVGILLSLIGGPFFFYLLMKNRRAK